MKTPLILLAGFAALTAASQGAMVITEYMYGTLAGEAPGEFVEFTNTGTTSIDMSNYSFDDSSATPGAYSLSGFGIVAPGESIILTDMDPDAFRTAWSLDASVKVVGGNNQNLGRGDAINLFDGTSLVDTLVYGDNVAGVGGVRTNGVSATTDPVNYGANTILTWTLSAMGQTGVKTSTVGDIGSPGYAAVPEASVFALAGIAGLGLLRRRRSA